MAIGRCLKCKVLLTWNTPLDMIYCPSCQDKLQALEEGFVAKGYGLLTPEHNDFIFLNPIFCIATELGRLIGLTPNGIWHASKSKRIRTKKKVVAGSSTLIVPRREMIRVILLATHWITVRQVALDLGLDYTTLSRYAKEGHFGKTHRDIGGRLSIRREIVPQVLEIFNEVKEIKKHNHSGKNFMKQNEFTPGMIADRFDMTIAGIDIWIKNGWLTVRRSSKNGKYRFISRLAFANFLKRIVRGKYRVSTHVRSMAIEISRELEGKKN
jgi:hypothetical protein